MAKKKEPRVIVSGKGPVFSLALGLCFSAAIAYNALGRQDARHPAPFEGFWNLDAAETKPDGPILKPRHERDSAVVPKSDPLIAELQAALRDLGFYEGEIDGLNGPKTRTAIVDYQRRHKLEAGGKASSALLDHVKLNLRIKQAVEQPSTSSITGGSKQVRLVQDGLSELGYSPGPSDGVLGDQTEQAIRNFQQDRRLKVTGRITDALISELRKTTGISSLNSGNGNS